MDSLRTPFLVAASIAFFLVVVIELGSLAIIDHGAATNLSTPGLGIPALALMDGIVFFTFLMMTLAVAVPERLLGAIQGIVTFVVMVCTLVGGIVVVMVAIGLLILMITLLMAVPFGTAFYMATYSTFDTGAARATLAAVMFLKIVAVVCVFLAQQKFLEVKGLVLLILSSFLVSLVVSVLHALVLDILVSIADAAAAIVVGIVALIWALVKLIGSIPGIVKGLRVDRHVT